VTVVLSDENECLRPEALEQCSPEDAFGYNLRPGLGEPGGGSQSGHLETRDAATAMDRPNSSTPHKMSQGSSSLNQAISVGTTSDISPEDATFLLPHLQIVTPETFLKENFGEAACSSLPADFNPTRMKLLSPIPSGHMHRPENAMCAELVGTYHPKSLLG
jgi:hypothetical protein